MQECGSAERELLSRTEQNLLKMLKIRFSIGFRSNGLLESRVRARLRTRLRVKGYARRTLALHCVVPVEAIHTTSREMGLP